LESTGLVLIYLLKGKLPWQGLYAETKKDKYLKIKQVKLDTPIETLCTGIPHEFATYLTYARALHFEEAPDYTYCQALFRYGLRRLNLQYDFQYDWAESATTSELDKVDIINRMTAIKSN
jgi:hypothetical protein